MTSSKRVLLPLAEGVEEMEAVTLIDILRRGGVEVLVAGLNNQPVLASRGVRLLPDAALAEVLDTEFDLVVLPGGLGGTEQLKAQAPLLDLLKSRASQGKWIAAICAAPQVLAEAGILQGRKLTAYPGALSASPDYQLSQEAVVEDAWLLTSRGPGTALDFALHLLEKLMGPTVRAEVEAGLVR